MQTHSLPGMKYLFIYCLLLPLFASAQIPVEIFAGHKSSTIDVLFFKNFKNKEGANSHWLFFNRNRAAIDYRMTTTSHLPVFGLTEAISFNHPKLKGFAPVIVAQVFNNGVFPKAGVQYVRIRKKITVFSWIVSETVKKPDLDHFLLVRYTPPLSKKTKLFTQLETLSVFPTAHHQTYRFTQRVRLGLQLEHFQTGLGLDLNQRGRKLFTHTNNTGLFVRYEF